MQKILNTFSQFVAKIHLVN